jgi:hypothetical protein
VKCLERRNCQVPLWLWEAVGADLGMDDELAVHATANDINGLSEIYFRTSKYTGSPRTILVICRKEPVSDMRSPPKDAYAVL